MSNNDKNNDENLKVIFLNKDLNPILNINIIEDTRGPRQILSFACLLTVVLLAYFVKDIKIGFEILGGTTSNLIVFIIPSLFYIKSNQNNKSNKLL